MNGSFEEWWSLDKTVSGLWSAGSNEFYPCNGCNELWKFKLIESDIGEFEIAYSTIWPIRIHI